MPKPSSKADKLPVNDNTKLPRIRLPQKYIMATLTVMSPDGRGLFFVRFITASCSRSWTWFRVEAAADKKKTPNVAQREFKLNRPEKKKHPVSVENAIASDKLNFDSFLYISNITFANWVELHALAATLFYFSDLK